MRRRLAVFAVATAIGLAACGGSSKPSPFAAKASQLVDDIAAGRYEDVHHQFDSNVAGHLSADELAVDWRSIQRDIGPYRSKGTPKTNTHDAFVTERVPLQMGGGGKAVMLVTYNKKDGTIAGLYFANADQKASSSSVPAGSTPGSTP